MVDKNPVMSMKQQRLNSIKNMIHYFNKKVQIHCKKRNRPLPEQKKQNGLIFFFSGAISITVAEMLTATLERVKIFKQISLINPNNFIFNAKSERGYTSRGGAQKRVKDISNVRSQFNFFNIVKKIYRTQGVNGLFRGITAQLYKQFIVLWAYMTFFDQIKYKQQQSSSKCSFNLAAVTGASFIAFICHPFDLAHTHLASNTSSMHQKRKFISTWDVLEDVRKNFGFKGWFHGIVPQLISTGVYGVAFGIFFMKYPMGPTAKPGDYARMLVLGLGLESLLFCLDTWKKLNQINSNFTAKKLLLDSEYWLGPKMAKKYFSGLSLQLIRLPIMLVVISSLSGFFQRSFVSL